MNDHKVVGLALLAEALPGHRRIRLRSIHGAVVTLTACYRNGLSDRYGNADWALGFRLEWRRIFPEYASFGAHTPAAPISGRSSRVTPCHSREYHVTEGIRSHTGTR